MLRDLAIRIMVVFRLAIVVSLVGYTMPNAYAAMHGSAYSDVQISAAAEGHDDGHSHMPQADHADAGHHGDGLEKKVKQDCCQDFCFAAALPTSCQAEGPVTVSSTLRFFDDGRVHGTRPSLHRPPNI